MKLSWPRQVAQRLGLAAALLALAACGGSRSPLAGIIGDIPPPDEFQVIARRPLEMPPSASLPEPQPGAPSRLDPNPQRDAVNALLGASGRTVVATQPSAGEQVLLTSANAAAASGEIRVQLEEEKTQAEANKPYVPPSLGQLFGGGAGEKVDEAEVLDPVAEAQRLQREGVRAPSDPSAEAASGDEAEPETAPTNYPSGRPQKPFQVTGTGPSY